MAAPGLIYPSEHIHPSPGKRDESEELITQTVTVKQSSAGPALVLSSSSHRQRKGTDFLKQVQQSRCIQMILMSLRLLTSGVMFTFFH